MTGAPAAGWTSIPEAVSGDACVWRNACKVTPKPVLCERGPILSPAQGIAVSFRSERRLQVCGKRKAAVIRRIGQADPSPLGVPLVAQKCAVLRGLCATVIVISETTGQPQVVLSQLFEFTYLIQVVSGRSGEI